MPTPLWANPAPEMHQGTTGKPCLNGGASAFGALQAPNESPIPFSIHFPIEYHLQKVNWGEFKRFQFFFSRFPIFGRGSIFCRPLSIQTDYLVRYRMLSSTLRLFGNVWLGRTMSQ